MENMYTSDKSSKLDARAVFIVQGLNDCFWKGASIPPENVAVYLNEANRYAKIFITE